MVQFALIEQLEAMAIAKGWHFVYKFDEFYANIETQREYADGAIVLTVDSRSRPIVTSGRITEVRYTTLLALGRKFDANGEVASLDETFHQKYDRRLRELESTLATAIAGFACTNQLDVSFSDFVFDINVYDTNIDFVTTTANFIQ